MEQEMKLTWWLMPLIWLIFISAGNGVACCYASTHLSCRRVIYTALGVKMEDSVRIELLAVRWDLSKAGGIFVGLGRAIAEVYNLIELSFTDNGGDCCGSHVTCSHQKDSELR